jgi:hypothetical protein
MTDITERLRAMQEVGVPTRLELEAADEIERLEKENRRLSNLLKMPLSSAELKLVDKNCDWVAFGHAWNAVIKHRLAALTIGELHD